MICRREFITLLGGAATWPLAARAQQGERVRRIGVLLTLAESDPEVKASLTAFQERLQQLGWTQGRNLWIDFRSASGDQERLKTYAGELLRMAPDVLFCQGVPALLALHQLTPALPIVFVQVSDPVSLGFVAIQAATLPALLISSTRSAANGSN
jgi:putative ABC transport system substrate-binding protein